MGEKERDYRSKQAYMTPPGYKGTSGSAGYGGSSKSGYNEHSANSSDGSSGPSADLPVSVGNSPFTVRKTGQAIGASPEEAIRTTHRSDEDN